jgi:nucleoside-diphosphate-sugar epimerase
VKAVADTVTDTVTDNVTGDVLTEKAKPDPQTAYGRSKLAAERYVLEAMERRNEEAKERLNDEMLRNARNDRGDARNDKGNARNDKRVYILRPCMIHGPGNKGNLNLLYNVVRKGIPWPLGAFDNQRSFVSIDNVAFVLRRLIEKDIPSGVYQLADDEAVSTNALIRLIAESLGSKPRIWKLPRGFIRFMARTGDLLHLPLNSERLKKLTESYVVSNAKIKNALGVDSMPISAIKGLKATLESFYD